MITELAEDIFAIEARFEDVPMKVYVILADRITVIDPGTSNTPLTRIEPALTTLGLRLKNIDLIINTHGHHDHRGGNGAIKKANPSVHVAAHRDDAPWIEDSGTYIADEYLRFHPDLKLPKSFLSRVSTLCGEDSFVDELLIDGQEVRLGPGHTLFVRHVPAHTPGSIAVFHEQQRVLFVGDALQARGTPLWKRPDFFPAYASLYHYQESLEYFEGCGAKLIGTSHQGVCTPHRAANLIADSRTFTNELSAYLYQHLRRRKRTTLSEAANSVLGEWPRYERTAQLFKTVGAHLDELQRDGLAASMSGAPDIYNLVD